MRRSRRRGLPRVAVDAARARAVARAGDRRSRDRRRALGRLLRARRRAGERAPGRGALHLRDGGGQPPSGGLRGRRVERAADRAHRRPAARAARHRRRADDRPAEALRLVRAVVLRGRAPTRPTTPGCSTCARSRAGPSPPPRGEPARARSTSTCPGATRSGPSRSRRSVTATSPLALEGARDRPLTAVAGAARRRRPAELVEVMAGHVRDALAG